MIQKKVCLLGAFAVGKTSLVSRFVHSIFSETYLTTIGVRIDKKAVAVGGDAVTLLLWDIAGEDEFLQVRMSYVRGTAGCVFVADGTRAVTLDQARELRDRVLEAVGDVPCVLALNKTDLTDEWEIDPAAIAALEADGWSVVRTSAKTGDGVERMFLTLAERMTGA